VFAFLAWFAVKIPRRVFGFVSIRGIRVKYLSFIGGHLWPDMDFRLGLPHRPRPMTGRRRLRPGAARSPNCRDLPAQAVGAGFSSPTPVFAIF